MCHSRQGLFSLPLSRRTYAAAAKRNTDSNQSSYEASRQVQQARDGAAPMLSGTPPSSEVLRVSEYAT